MFEGFFYDLRQHGVAASPTGFLRLQRALAEGLVTGLDDLYAVARALLVKSERQFDLYDRVFAHAFEGAEPPEELAAELDQALAATLREWLSDPAFLLGLPPEVRAAVEGLDPEGLLKYFQDRLKQQEGRHDGGNFWIGTRGTSPVGHSGFHPGGLRVGGRGGRGGAVKVALERRYLDYSDSGPLTAQQLGEALRALRHMTPAGPRDRLDVDASIRETVSNGGEIELVFDRRLVDKLSVFLFIDNGGWSMDPYVELTRALFQHARDSFRTLRTFFFHNCLYDTVWEDPRRYHKPVKLDELLREPAETRLIVVGDASMAPWELFHRAGAIDVTTRQRKPAIRRLEELAERFPHRAWINPIPEHRWGWAYGAETIGAIGAVFPMFELTLAGLEQAVQQLRRSRAD
jgi:uncharacterized protein with von Willebrand factor type A (vWA) domain